MKQTMTDYKANPQLLLFFISVRNSTEASFCILLFLVRLCFI